MFFHTNKHFSLLLQILYYGQFIALFKKFLWNSFPTNSEGSFSEVVNENIVCYHRKIEPIDNNAKCDENLIGHTIIIDKGLKLKIV